jgi:hypothetical protein
LLSATVVELTIASRAQSALRLDALQAVARLIA